MSSRPTRAGELRAERSSVHARREWLIALPILIVAVGQIFSKLGVLRVQETGVPFNGLLLAGYSMLVLRGVIWIYILGTVRLAFAYPLMSISYIVVLFISWLLFEESVTWPKIAGCLMIMAGVGVVTIAERRGSETVDERA